MAKLSSCKSCGEQLQPEEKHIHSSKTYCILCYEKVKRDSDEYKQLLKYICEIYDIERPSGLMLKQIKEYKEEYSYTYGGILYTLWYLKEILNKEFIPLYGVSLVKFCYDEAKNYYIHQEEIKKSMVINGKVEIKTKIVKVNRNNNKKNSSLIDLSNLIEGGDNH